MLPASSSLTACIGKNGKNQSYFNPMGRDSETKIHFKIWKEDTLSDAETVTYATICSCATRMRAICVTRMWQQMRTYIWCSLSLKANDFMIFYGRTTRKGIPPWYQTHGTWSLSFGIDRLFLLQMHVWTSSVHFWYKFAVKCLERLDVREFVHVSTGYWYLDWCKIPSIPK